MSGGGSLGFGRSHSKQSNKTSPIFGGTAHSTRDGNVINFDPSIRALQEQGAEIFGSGVAKLGAGVRRFGQSLGELRSRLGTNQDPFMQARTRPLIEEQKQARGRTTEDLTRRGLGGSSFLPQTITSMDSVFNRDIADQRALAMNESIQAGISIDQMLLEADALAAQGDAERAAFLRGAAEDRARLESSVMTTTGGFGSGRSESFNFAGSGYGGGQGGGGGGGIA